MNPFDDAILPKEMQMLKVFLPFLPVGLQKFMAIYIRWTELTNTLAWFQSHRVSQKTPDAQNLMECVKGVLPPEEQAQMEQFANIFENMDMYREMFESFSQTPSPDGEGDSA